MRNEFKCSRCRRKKIKCTRKSPWEPTHQKCDECSEHHNAPCGPDYRKRDDPGESESPNGVTAHEETSTREDEDQPRAPAFLPSSTVHSAGFTNEHPGNEPSLVTEESNGQRKRKFASDKRPDELSGEAASLLQNLNSLGRAYAFGSELTPVNCRIQDDPIPFNRGPENKMKAIRDELHLLFVGACQLGIDSDASPIFKDLVIALMRYPGTYDDRKYNALWKIAEFYRVKGDQDEHEWLLAKASEAHDPSLHTSDPWPPLAASLAKTSRRAADDLLKLWKKVYMADEETSLAIPPIQRSAQYGNTGITSMLLDRPNSITRSPPALFNQEGLHIAANRGHEPNLKTFLRAGAEVDARDIHRHTALFLAAAKGHKGCCAELINSGADVNARDVHGTTVLEAAAGAGHLNVVQLLVKNGAEVNPNLICCGSSPLQAAIENQGPTLELALYLMGKGGDVKVPRWDGKNAIDLAEGKSALLARILRQKAVLGPQGPFDPPQFFSFDHNDLDFGPGPREASN